MRIGRDTEGRRSRGLIMSEYFSFALMQKKGTKRKNQGCTCGATPPLDAPSVRPGDRSDVSSG